MNNILKVRFCDRCHQELPLGATKYNVRIEIDADWDGYLPDMEKEDEHLASHLLAEIAQLDEESLEDQVHMELTLTLCPTCRRLFLEDLDQASDGKPVRKFKPPINLQ